MEDDPTTNLFVPEGNNFYTCDLLERFSFVLPQDLIFFQHTMYRLKFFAGVAEADNRKLICSLGNENIVSKFSQ
jgi:hypothetical protein